MAEEMSGTKTVQEAIAETTTPALPCGPRYAAREVLRNDGSLAGYETYCVQTGERVNAWLFSMHPYLLDIDAIGYAERYAKDLNEGRAKP